MTRLHLVPASTIRVRASLLTAFIGAALAAACLNDSPSGLPDDGSGAAAGDTGSAGNAAHGGNKANAGSANGQGAMASSGEGGAGVTAGATSTIAGEGGAPNVAAEGGAGGAHEPDGAQIGPVCTYHTEAPAPVEATAGAGGEGPVPDVVAQVSPFVGVYLTDATGRTLYTHGGDLAGDCEHPPQSGCVDECLVSWPPFHAGARVLGENLNDADFGVIEHPAAGLQTTYKGWPLYYYKSDLTLGQMTGQGKGKIWHIAEADLPAVTIMKSGMLRYLADASGHTLYVSADDQAGSVDSDPVSNCKSTCLQTFEAFHPKNFSVVTVLESSSFQVFARKGMGGLQLAYKGQPLYRAATDVKSGDMNGTAMTGFTAAIP
jgi:predicted lipoprotein with Yx(FWY)xxD motif